MAAAHLLQLTLMFYLGAVLKSQHMTAPGQLRASFAIFGLVYALQVGAQSFHRNKSHRTYRHATSCM